jgi:HEAT repeat protein
MQSCWRASRYLLVTLCLAAPAVAAPRYNAGQVAELVEIVQSEKAPEGRRAKAVRELEHTDERTHMSVLRRLLREERSLDIRLSAAVTLAALGDHKAPRDLLLASAYDLDHTPNCSRSDVLRALGQMKDPAAELHLGRALKTEAPEDEPYFYADACRALAALATPGANKLLLDVMRDGSAAVRFAAVSPLGTIATGRSAERAAARQALVLAARSDADEKVAEQAGSALLWMGVDGGAFFSMLERDPNPAVRSRLARVMNRHYLSPARIARLRSALALETDTTVRLAIEKTLANQPSK